MGKISQLYMINTPFYEIFVSALRLEDLMDLLFSSGSLSSFFYVSFYTFYAYFAWQFRFFTSIKIAHSIVKTARQPATIPELSIKLKLIESLSVRLGNLEELDSSTKKDQPPVTRLKPLIAV